MNEDNIDRDLPLKQEISDNIRRLMKSKGWTQLKLAEESGISKSTLSDYLNCKTLVNLKNVGKLAKAFNVQKDKIDPTFKSEEGEETNSNCTDLPLYGQISCGDGIVMYDGFVEHIATPKSWIGNGSHFYLTANGDSMTGAKIHEGDLLLIRSQEEVENGEIAAVAIDDSCVLKRVYKDNQSFTLVSENPKYAPLHFDPKTDKNIRILGRLKMTMTKF